MAKRPSKKNLQEMISAKYGIIKDVAEAYGVTRQAIYLWLEKYPELKEDVKKGKDRLVDLAKSKLIENIEAGKEKSIIFALETIGKGEGFTKLVEVRDKSKFDDQFDDLSNEELEQLLLKTTQKLTDS